MIDETDYIMLEKTPLINHMQCSRDPVMVSSSAH